MTIGISIKCHLLSVTFSYCYAECHYAECYYAECHYAECRGVLLGINTLAYLVHS